MGEKSLFALPKLVWQQSVGEVGMFIQDVMYQNY